MSTKMSYPNIINIIKYLFAMWKEIYYIHFPQVDPVP